MNYKYILFDLDGTLTDPKVGITNSVKYALNKMGFDNIDVEELIKFIGPPLKDSFTDYYGLGEEETNQAITYYREYFQDKGIYENEMYKGIIELLKDLKDNGYILAVATSKPTDFAKIIIDYFNIAEYFSHVIGSNLDGTRTKKAEVIKYALKKLNVKDNDKIIMIGDREHDIIGANHVGIDSIGVEYGYGSFKELEKAGATYIVKNIQELKTLLMSSSNY